MKINEFSVENVVTESHFGGLWRLMTGYRPLYLAAILMVAVGAIVGTGISLALAHVVDDVFVLSRDEMMGQLPWFALLFVALAVVRGALFFGGGRLAAYVAERLAQRLRDFMYDHIMRLSFSTHDRQQTGELLQRATSDVDVVRKLFAEQALGMGRIFLLFIVNFCVLWTINGRLALSTIVVAPIVILSGITFFRFVEKRFEAMQDQDAKMTNRLQENLSGIRVVRAFARHDFERERFAIENNKRMERSKAVTRVHSVYWPGTDLICGIQTAAAYYIGARMAMAGTITPGQFIASLSFITAIIWPIRHLGRFIADTGAAVVSFGRIKNVIGIEKEQAEAGLYPDVRPDGRIIFDDVSFTYTGESEPVLHNISFEVEAGQTVALLGSTGSGKSTLVNLLPRFYEHTAGSISLDGVNLNALSPAYLRDHIGVVQQDPFLFAATIEENVRYGTNGKTTMDQVVNATSAAAVHSVIQTFPNGYDTRVGEKGVTLSGGQKQRTTLARTLLRQPSILILDAATSAVDTETEANIRQALHEQRCTTFLIAHRIQSVMTADLILVMADGRIVERGVHDELMELNGVYRQIYDAQEVVGADHFPFPVSRSPFSVGN